jgi:NhaP-type Na+/H+ or K+/H+ antiporter
MNTTISIILGCLLGLALVILVLWIVAKLARKHNTDISQKKIYGWFQRRR